MVTAKLNTPDGIAIEIDAPPFEFESALTTALRALRASAPAAEADRGPTPAMLQKMVEKLSDQTIEYLRLLVEEPAGLSDDELVSLLGLEGRRQKLAGMNGSITKAADSVGITTDIIARDVDRDAEGHRTYHYKLPNDIRTKLANALPEEPEPEPAAPPPVSDDDVPF